MVWLVLLFLSLPAAQDIHYQSMSSTPKTPKKHPCRSQLCWYSKAVQFTPNVRTSILVLGFFKTLFKGKNCAVLRVQERVNSLLITILHFLPTSWKHRTLCLDWHLLRLVERIIFKTRICASLGSRMKFKTLCYPVFGRTKNTALPSFWFPIILLASNASIICPTNHWPLGGWLSWLCSSY